MRDQRLELYELPDYKSRKKQRQTITASIRTNSRPRPIPAWATTSTSTTNGAVEIDGARFKDRTKEHLGFERQGRSCNIAGCCGLRSRRSAGGEKPMLFSGRSQWPVRSRAQRRWTASARRGGWETYWMGSRRQAPPRRAHGTAPVPKEIADNVHRLTGGGVRVTAYSSSLRAKRSNPVCHRGCISGLLRRCAPRNDGGCGRCFCTRRAAVIEE